MPTAQTLSFDSIYLVTPGQYTCEGPTSAVVPGGRSLALLSASLVTRPSRPIHTLDQGHIQNLLGAFLLMQFEFDSNPSWSHCKGVCLPASPLPLPWGMKTVLPSYLSQ